MGFLRADGPTLPMQWQRFVIERRWRSIGTLLFRSQCKRVSRLAFGLALGISVSVSRARVRGGDCAGAAGRRVAAAPSAASGCRFARYGRAIAPDARTPSGSDSAASGNSRSASGCDCRYRSLGRTGQ